MKLIEQIIKENLLKTKESTRIFHGRGKLWVGFEYVNIDYFPPTVLITLYKESSDDFIDELVSVLKKSPDLVFENILLQKRYLSRPLLVSLVGTIPSEAIAVENGSKFHLKFGDTQNIGFFLDMAAGRKKLESFSNDKKVLNLFSYTCSLSVAAIRGGASHVVNVDMSKPALQVGESNHTLNAIDMKKARFLSYDIMKSWNTIFKHGPFDIVVIDPPTNQGESFRVERDYHKIISRLNKMTKKEAVVMACLNSPFLKSQYLIDLFLELAPEYILQEVLYSAFSGMELNPEEGLKILIFKKENAAVIRS